MKHRLLLLLLFVFATFATGWAQKAVAPSFTIKGVLLDSLTQEGEPYATIKEKCSRQGCKNGGDRGEW